MKKNAEEPSLNVTAAEKAVSELSLIPFFPGDPHARASLVRFFLRMVSTEQQLQWLVDSALDLYSQWPGPHELRALYCSHFKPKDGLEAYSAGTPSLILTHEEDSQ